MCGICGFAYASSSSEAEKRVRQMAAAMVHRGPDEDGFLVNDLRAPGAALGMRRLSIIDLPGGHQPIWNEAQNVAVVFNGELYNYRELRERLHLAGHRFTTNSDTEILVHGWEEWGEDLLGELRGMFAFALLDLRKHFATVPVLLLARDPVGIKPLYYAQTKDGFVFASELRALLASRVVERKLSGDALTSYLLFGSVSEPVTLVEGAFSLPPGHALLLHLPDRRRTPRVRPWWDPTRSAAARDPKRPRDFAAASARLRTLLEDAVRAHLIADVPVGLFLSSGLDSSAVAVLAGRAQRGIKSFTLTFPDTAWDEGPLARVVAQRAGTQHTEVPLQGRDMLARVDEAISALDQPTMDGINTYFVSWAAREVGLKVALSGLGSDELFGGYRTFSDTPKLVRLEAVSRLVPGAFRRISVPLVNSLLARKGTVDAARKASDAWLMPEVLPHPYFFARLLFPPSEVARLADARYRKSSVASDGVTLDPTWLGWLERTADQAVALEPVAGVSWLEMRTYMASTLLRDTDSVSMARSLEVRVPFLDTPLVEFVSALPDAARIEPGVSKGLVRAALAGLIPAEILEQKKRTFTLPWEEWLRTSLKPRVEASLKDLAPGLRGQLHTAGVGAVWDNFLAGQTTWSRPWSLYVLNEWCRHHLS
ncbi:MAG TPA: asparagine synthase (glutamine-hydrolyzing) [Candidatus Sulfotelmatobacter sp.]|nr:asparagine synthase (glutamine-hydrolyzing) [Candidatus Sulfotelmatobacter sp.]